MRSRRGPVTTGPEIPASRTVLSIQILNPDRRHAGWAETSPRPAPSQANGLLLSSGTLIRPRPTGCSSPVPPPPQSSGGSAASYVNGPLTARCRPASSRAAPTRSRSARAPSRCSSSSTRRRTRAAPSRSRPRPSTPTQAAPPAPASPRSTTTATGRPQITGGAGNFTNTSVRLTEQGTVGCERHRPIRHPGRRLRLDRRRGLAAQRSARAVTITSLGYFAVGRLTGAPTISGSFNVGAGGDFTTLTAAVAALNSRGHDRSGHLLADRQHVCRRDLSDPRSTRTAARAPRTR